MTALLVHEPGQGRAARIGLPSQDCKNKTTRAEQKGEYSLTLPFPPPLPLPLLFTFPFLSSSFSPSFFSLSSLACSLPSLSLLLFPSVSFLPSLLLCISSLCFFSFISSPLSLVSVSSPLCVHFCLCPTVSFMSLHL